MSFSCYYVPYYDNDNLFSIRRDKQTMHLSPPAREFILGWAHFPSAHVIRLTMDRISENRAGLPSA